MGILANLNDVGSSLQNITGIVNQYVVAPAAAFGMAGYVFNATGEANAHLSTEISDHYAEDNTFIQDQIAVHPKRITLKGYVGELVYNGAGGSPSIINTLAQKLTSISAFLPVMSSSVQQAQQIITNPAIATFSSILGVSSNIFGLMKNVLGAFGEFKNQQNAYLYFKALMQSKTLMSIQTPWEFMTGMAIESLTTIQPENTEWMSDFSVTFKEMRIASTQSGPISNASGTIAQQAIQATVAAAQQVGVTNLGNIAGQVAGAVADTLTGGIFGNLSAIIK